ncbi:MAG: NYN domain-containing protein [Gemmatimonadales bacterium]
MKDLVSRRDANASPHAEALRRAPNAALLIDFDNVTMGIRSDLQTQLKTMLNTEIFKGKISVQRAYADWRRYPQYIVPLSEASIDLIFAPAFGSNKKNATDIRLAIDALELVFTRPEIGTFILLSGDSDFSSLVLKLKEYGKYVIGIGLRESSSDLLIQNCDEYYSYNELTGLMKEGDDSSVPRKDVWELVIEAAEKMQANGDVMRSDRLKQVMQELDPSFDEKDAGYSKYAKFLQEIQRRGLLTLTRLDNGQYEISMGKNANAQGEIAAGGERGVQETDAEERSRGRSRRGGRGRGRREETETVEAAPVAAPSNGHAQGLVLARAFDVLRTALTGLGAVGEESTDAEQVRERMLELHGSEDPLFDVRRFPRFLRQANDAGVIQLAKAEDTYLLRLSPTDPGSQAAVEPDEAGDSQIAMNADAGPRPRSRRGGRGRERRPDREETAASAPAAPAASDPAPRAPSRNPRFRQGSRGASNAPAASAGAIPGPVSGATPPAAPAAPKPPSGDTRRSVRGRSGTKSGRPAPSTPPAEGPRTVASPSADVLPERSAPLPPISSTIRVPPDPEPQQAENAEREDDSLFKRMSAAFQRALGGDQE